MGKGVGGSLSAIFQLKFFQDVFQMGFHGIDRNGQFFRNLLVSSAASNQAKHQ